MAEQWRDISQDKLNATALFFFDEDNVATSLKTKPGDTVHLLMKNQYWYCGYISGYSDFIGIIPKSHVHVNQLDQLNMIDSKSYKIYQETSTRLKEYLIALIRAYKSARMDRFQTAYTIINEIISDRRVLMQATLTAEKNDTIKTLVQLMDRVDNVMDMDKIIRNSEMIKMDFDHFSPTELFYLYANPREQEELYGGHLADFTNENGGLVNRKSRSASSLYEDQQQMKIPNFYIEMKKPDFNVDTNYHFLFAICTSDKPIQYLTDHVGFEFKNGHIINYSSGVSDVDMVAVLFYNLRTSDMFRNLILIGKVYRSGRILEEKKDHDGKRLVCAGAIPLKQFMNPESKTASESGGILNFHSVPSSEYGEVEDFLVNKQLKSIVYQIPLKIQYIMGSLTHLKREHSFLFSPNMSVVRPTQFPEVNTLECSQQRCDLYIRLREYYIDKNQRGTKLNVAVKVSVFNSNGKLIPNCLFTTDGRYSYTCLNSSVTFHSNNPQFSDTFRISLSDSAMTDCHVRFLFHHLPTKTEKEPMLIGYTILKIKDTSTDAIINDGKHTLFVYKQEGANLFENIDYLSQEFNQESEFATVNKFASSRVNSKDYFIINTALISTGLTTNPNIQALMCYRKRFSIQDYNVVFENLTYVSDPETLRLSSAILVSSINLTELVFIDFTKPLTIILRILALLSDRKGSFYRGVFLKHANEIHAPYFNAKLSKTLLSRMDELENKDTRELIKTFLKSLPLLICIMKICCEQNIAKSKDASKEGSKDENKDESKDDDDDNDNNSESKVALQTVGSIIVELLMNLCNKFSNTDSRIFVLKIEMMTAIPHIMSECENLLTLDQLFELLQTLFSNVIQSSNFDTSQMTQQLNCMKFGEKLLCNLICCNEFCNNEEYRNRVIPFAFQQLNTFKSISGLISHFFNPLVNLVHYLEFEAIHYPENEQTDLKKHMFTNIYTYLFSDQVYENKSAKITSLSVIIVFFKLIKSEEFLEFHKNNSNEERLKYIQCLMKFCRYLLRDGVIPKNNFVLSIISCNFIVKIFIFCCQLSFVDNSLIFHRKTHSMMLSLALKLLRYSSLQLELFINERREQIIEVYGDARIDVIRWLYVLWDRLGNRRATYYDEFLLKFVQISMIDNRRVRFESLRLIGVTFTKIPDDLEGLQMAKNIIIDGFDVYLENCPNIVDYISYFIEETNRWGEEITDEDHLKNYKLITNQLNTTLLQLSDYRYGEGAGEGSTILKDICYYINAFYFKSIERYDLFIRNIHKLADHQISQEFYLEAGSNYMEHANLLEWCDDVLPATHDYPEEKEYVRKSEITMQAIHLISKEKEYDLCIEIAKQLYPIYDQVFMDYNKAGKLLTNMARYYQSVVNDVRCKPEYFCVGFYGKSFHLAIRNKQFVYRGKNFMKLGDLIKTLKANFPHSEVTGVTKEIDDTLKESAKQIIFCSGITPIPEDTHVINNEYASEKVKSYYLLNQTTKFSKQRPIIATEDVKNKWVEETIFTTRFMLPGPLNWSEIVGTSLRKISPIEIAIADIIKKTHSLSECITKVAHSPTRGITELCSLLNGIIDSAVNGGISKYAEAFLVDSYLKSSPQDNAYVNELSEGLVDQYNQTKSGLALHENFADPKFHALHLKMVTMFDAMRLSLESYCHVPLEQYFTSISLNQQQSTVCDSTIDSSTVTYKNSVPSSSIGSKPPRKNSGVDMGSGLGMFPSFTGMNEGRLKSGSIMTNKPYNVGLESDSGVKTFKSKSKSEGRSKVSNYYGSVSRKSRKSTGQAYGDPNALQTLFNDPSEDQQNITTPFIMDETVGSIKSKISSRSIEGSGHDSLDTPPPIPPSTSRSKNKFRWRMDKMRNRSRSQYRDE